jgi:hypothetical protein
LKVNIQGNGTPIAITKVPVMYRLLEYSGEPAKTADARQERPPQEAADGRESL